MTRPHFPSVIDSTLMSAIKACPRKAAWAYLDHYKPISTSVHLHAGKAYAEGLEAARIAFYLEGKSESESIALGLGALMRAYGDFECPEDSAKSLNRMMGAFEFYMERYPMPEDHAVPITLPSGKRGIEFSFAEPIDLEHPETGDPLVYVGRMDMICDYAGGRFGEDDKTTSSLGATWSRQWELRSQFTSYCWGARQAGIPLNGFLVRGVSILKTKYDTQEAITYRPAWLIDRWYEGMLKKLSDFIRQWEEGVFDYNLDESCNAYGGCEFKQVCQSVDPTPWLKGSFIRRRWDPVSREEILLGED